MSGVGIKWSAYIPHEPTVKQLAFLISSARELLYGGAAGGGKTDALLMGALQYTDVPGFSALLLRRTYPDLTKADSLIPRSHEWLAGKGPTWNETKKQWTFPSGAILEFGHLQRTNDVYNYHSATYQYIGFDELTSFEETQYRYLHSRLRKLEGLPAPLRVRAGSNPGGVGHAWVHRRFLVEGPGAGRVFIPARLEDNPYIDKEEYEKSLLVLDSVTYAMLRRGDWSARRTGSMFKREWLPIVPDLPQQAYRMMRYWDLAATEPRKGREPDWTVGALVGLGADGRWYIADIRRIQGTPGKVEELVAATAAEDGVKLPIAMEEEGGASGKTVIDHYARRVLVGYIFEGIRSTGSKLERARPLASAAEKGNVMLVSAPWNGDLIDELESQPGGSHDDQMDAISGVFAKLRPRVGYAMFNRNDERTALVQRERAMKAKGLSPETSGFAMVEVY